MNWNVKKGYSRQTINEHDVKICALCGTLNHHRNAACWTCGWRGAFNYDALTITLALQRLQDQYEEVRLEHVMPRRVAPPLGHFGRPKHTSRWQALCARCAHWWQGVQARRNARCAAREAHLKPRSATPPNELGV